jgi:hypothetical protein
MLRVRRPVEIRAMIRNFDRHNFRDRLANPYSWRFAMFEKLISSETARRRRREGAFADERERYLRHCAELGATGARLRVKANEFLWFAQHVRSYASDGVDEFGYLPIDRHGADLLFRIISERYERAPIVIATNRAYKHWAQIFNNDNTQTSAILDRVMHHVDTVVIEGKSFRMKDEVEE